MSVPPATAMVLRLQHLKPERSVVSTLAMKPPSPTRTARVARLESVRPARWTAGRVTRLGQVLLGVIWLIDGLLQFQPYMFHKTFVTTIIDPNVVGQPGIIAAPITWIAHLIEPRVALFNAFAATLQVAIGVGLLYRRTVKPALLASFVWAIGVWFTGEGLGMIFAGTANPLTGAPGAALLYIVAGLLCWPRTVRSEHRATETRVRPYGLLGERGARLAWAALWLGSAALWLFPANDSSGATHDAIAAVPSGAGWLTSVLGAAAKATAGHGTTIAIVMALVSAGIGVAALRRTRQAVGLVVAIAISLAFWVAGQGFGGVLTGQATDVGSAPLMILIASMLYALAPGRERRPMTVRSTLEPIAA